MARLKAFADLTAKPIKRDDKFAGVGAPRRARTSQDIERQKRQVGDMVPGGDVGRVGGGARRACRSIAISRSPKKGTGAAFAIGVTRDQAHCRARRAARRPCERSAIRPTPTSPRCCTRRCATASTRYEGRKQEAGALDFLDLLIKARDLVCDNAEVCREFRERFRVILVDEFQDTDPLQAELLLSSPAMTTAALRPGALFIVGDPKQSIYRFRRADVGAYRRIADDLGDERRDRGHAADVVSQRAGDSAFRERRVSRRDDRRSGIAAGRLRAAAAASRRRRRAAGDRRAADRRIRTARASTDRRKSRRPRSTKRSRGRSARSSRGCCRPNARGRSPTASEPPEDRRQRRLPAVPPLHAFRQGHHARLRRGARSARHSAPAGRRQDVPRARGSRCHSHGADRDRVARRRAVGVRDAARPAVRDRRRGAARISLAGARRFIRIACPKELPDRLQPVAQGADDAARAARRAQSSAGRRHDRPLDRDRRARMPASSCGAAASRCSPTCCTFPTWRGATSSRAACRSAASSTRCTTPRAAPNLRRRRSSKRAAKACG